MSKAIKQQNAERRLSHHRWHRDSLLRRLLRKLGVIW
jgi:hypothetical protein